MHGHTTPVTPLTTAERALAARTMTGAGVGPFGADGVTTVVTIGADGVTGSPLAEIPGSDVLDGLHGLTVRHLT